MSFLQKRFEVGNTVNVSRASDFFATKKKAVLLRETPEAEGALNTLTLMTPDGEKLQLTRQQGALHYYQSDEPGEKFWLDPLLN